MRVVHTFIKYPPAIGGHEKYVQELVEGLRSRGIDARVVTSTLRQHLLSRSNNRFGRLVDRLTRGTARRQDGLLLDAPYDVVNGVPVTRLSPERPLTRRVVLEGLRAALIELRPDVLHAHDIWRDSFEVTVDVAAELGVPLLLNPVYHDRSHERHSRRWRNELQRIAARVPGQARVFYNTPWEEAQLAAEGIRFERTDLLPPSIDVAELAGIPEAPVDGVPSGRLLVTCVARLHPRKRLDMLIRSFAAALARLRRSADPSAERAHLVLAGFRDSNEDYEALAAEYGIADRFTLLVDRPRADVINLLRRSSIFALPSACETFGIVVIEAWATGNLVFVSDHWALPHVVDHERNGIVCADGEWTERLAGGISGLESEWAQRLIAAGERNVIEQHQRGTRIDRLVGHLEEVTAR